jgi:hypothetical protein
MDTFLPWLEVALALSGALALLVLARPKVYGVLYVVPASGPPQRYDVYQGTYIVGTITASDGMVVTPKAPGRLVGVATVLRTDGVEYKGSGYFRHGRLVNVQKSKP